jgi:E-phenylitaconyl-CoA hydratase
MRPDWIIDTGMSREADVGVVLHRSGSILEITLDRPEAMNAMDTATYSELTAAFRSADADPEVRALIITGAGEKAFTSGADLKKMHGPDEATESWTPWRPWRWDFGVPCSKPMIAAINGYALAGGLELALYCDVRIASPNAQFGCPEVKWNLLHGFGALRLPRIVGLSNAMEMLLTGEFIDAESALRIGLVSRVVPLPELLPTARTVADRIAKNGPLAVQMTKELVLRGLDMSLEDGMRLYREFYARLGLTDDQREGTRAFAEKREPSFRGQ